jgi:hypothetical protein
MPLRSKHKLAAMIGEGAQSLPYGACWCLYDASGVVGVDANAVTLMALQFEQKLAIVIGEGA